VTVAAWGQWQRQRSGGGGSRGSGPKVCAIFLGGGRPKFLKPSKLRKNQMDGEQREALLLTTQ
jgi:hypothetical protein